MAKKIDIILKKGQCDFCPTKTELWGLEVVIPTPNCPDKDTKAFICECCLRNQVSKIQDRSYMENESI